jgi:hypothetical protein
MTENRGCEEVAGMRTKMRAGKVEAARQRSQRIRDTTSEIPVVFFAVLVCSDFTSFAPFVEV